MTHNGMDDDDFGIDALISDLFGNGEGVSAGDASMDQSRLHIPAVPDGGGDSGLCIPGATASRCYCQPAPRSLQDLTGPGGRFLVDAATGGTLTATCVACRQRVDTSALTAGPLPSSARADGARLSPRTARRAAAAAEAAALLGHLPEFHQLRVRSGARETESSRSGLRPPQPPSCRGVVKHHRHHHRRHHHDNAVHSLARRAARPQLSPRSARRAVAAQELIDNAGATKSSGHQPLRALPLDGAALSPASAPLVRIAGRSASDAPEHLEECFPPRWLDALRTVKSGRWKALDESDLGNVVDALMLEREDAALGDDVTHWDVTWGGAG